MKSRYWLVGWLLIVCVCLSILAVLVYIIDPYMHFRKPDTSKYFYSLSNQRSQNDGITKYFDYDALITGTSMTMNFKTSEMDEIFACNAIKVPYPGGTYKEINDNLRVAVNSNPNLRTVVRALDMDMFLDDKDRMRVDLGTYPTYLYDTNPFNDIQYLWNKDAAYKAFTMLATTYKEEFKPGITSFDDYSNWQYLYTFGINTICPEGIPEISAGEAVYLTAEEKETIRGNITQNVINLAKDHPEITFYYFFPPYSAEWWRNQVVSGRIYKQIEEEQYVIELLLECDNIKLFSFNNRLDITTDFNNYTDSTHYGQWLNSLMLRWMHDGGYQLTKDNYLGYLKEEMDNYLGYDYGSLNEQIDYESDFYAAALLNEELTGAKPIFISDMNTDELHLSGASIIEDQYNGARGIECVGCLNREPESEISVYDYIVNNEYVGAKVEIPAVDDYSYLVFYGKKASYYGQPTVYVIDGAGEKVGEMSANYQDLDREWHQYVVDITNAKGDIKVIFNGGCIDKTGRNDAKYIFSDIMLY